MSSFVFHLLLLSITAPFLSAASGFNQWQLLQKSIGIVSMHAQLLNNDRVIIFDRTDFGLSNLTLPDGRCRHDPYDKALKVDCTAHSVEYDVASNTFRPLFVQTDVWCSSAAAVANGTLVQTGGYNDGQRKVRSIDASVNGTCDWKEISDDILTVKRWYSTNHFLPDGRQIIIGGRRQFSYEFYPKVKATEFLKPFFLRFLVETNDVDVENNLYPFVILNVDGNLFIFANNRAILFNYKNDTVVRTYPEIPGGEPRCYPSTGSAVLLPLKNLEAENVEAEVLICGGARIGAFKAFKAEGSFYPALDTCARIKITDLNATWTMEKMPMERVMNDMVMLPNGDVLLINGAGLGTAGWERAKEPVLQPVVYKTNNESARFELQCPTNIPRLYHSTAFLVRDGRVIVGGSNPHEKYNFGNVTFPTELSLEAFSPPYLDPVFSHLRPVIINPVSHANVTYGQKFNMSINVDGLLQTTLLSVTMLSPPFNTHSFSMNQRLLVLTMDKVNVTGNSSCEFQVTAPCSAVLAPPGFYLLFAVHQEIPSQGTWIKMQ